MLLSFLYGVRAFKESGLVKRVVCFGCVRVRITLALCRVYLNAL